MKTRTQSIFLSILALIFTSNAYAIMQQHKQILLSSDTKPTISAYYYVPIKGKFARLAPEQLKVIMDEYQDGDKRRKKTTATVSLSRNTGSGDILYISIDYQSNKTIRLNSKKSPNSPEINTARSILDEIQPYVKDGSVVKLYALNAALADKIIKVLHDSRKEY